MPTAKIYFIRHGETDENRQGIIQGQLDTDMNEIGLDQSEVVAKELQSVPFDEGFSSDLKRAMKVLFSFFLSLSGIFSWKPDHKPKRPQKLSLTIIQEFNFRHNLNCERG